MNSREEHWGYPKQITVGNNDGFRCWDVALPKLHSGDKVVMKCPSYLVLGGAHVMSGLGGYAIPYHEDITFDLDILECDKLAHRQDPKVFVQPHTTTMQPDQCFYLRSYMSNGSGNMDFVLSTVEDGGKPVLAVEHHVTDDKDQQWFWNETDGSIYNANHPGYVVDIGVDQTTRHTLALAPKTGHYNQTHFDYQNDQMLIP